MGKVFEVLGVLQGKARMFPRRVKAFAKLPLRSQTIFLRALILNPVFRITVKRRGLKSAAALARRIGGNRPIDGSTPATLKTASEIVLGVRAAAGALPIEVVCLPRSLSSWTLLRRRGIGSDLLIGWDNASDKRTAHAWVVVEGEAVGENPDQIQRLAAFHDPILSAS
jgi:hypothetical protein